VDGEAFLYMTTTDPHERALQFLNKLIGLFADVTGAGLVRRGPYAVRPEGNGPVREPDLLFVRADRAHLVQHDAMHGAPDLVVEIVSDDSTTRDRRTKYREYEAAGVREYWVIDPREGRQREEFFALEGGAYGPIAADSEGRVHSRALPGFWVRPAWLRDPEAQPLRCLAEIVGPERIIEALR
jgi:Uma2 family endonuclease